MAGLVDVNGKEVKLVIGLPTRQYTPGRAYTAITGELLRTPNIVAFLTTVGTVITDARNSIAGAALNMYRNGDATHLLWLDDDMLPPERAPGMPGMAERLLAHGKRIVSGLYFGESTLPVAHQLRKVREILPPQRFLENRQQLVRVDPNDGLIEVGAVGFGGVLMEISILDELEKQWPREEPFQYHVAGVGEDYFFCSRLEAMGIPIYLDTSLCLGHLKYRAIHWETYWSQWNDHRLTEFENGNPILPLGAHGVMEDVDASAGRRG